MEQITKEHPNSGSADLVRDNIEQLAQLFPEVIKEGKVDFEALHDLLGEYGDTAEERFCLNWAGKAQARREAQKRSTGTLRPCKDDSVDWDTTENLYIEGDNLEVLKLLQKSYHKQVKMIYIDPPYNTGKDFVYKDNYKDNMANYLELTGQDRTMSTKALSDSDGRYHSNWLNMMYPRLKLARNLLTDDGVIFISIDDNEVNNLKKICDEVFGEENYINSISIKAKASSGASGGGEDKRLKKNIEYLLAYSKSARFESFKSVYKFTPLDKYISERKQENKNFAYTSVLVNEGTEEYHSTIKAGNGEDIIIKKVVGYEIKSISKLSKELSIPEYEVYKRYINKIFTLENAQTSIRDRVIEATGNGDEFYNCYYKPISGRNKGIETRVGFMGTTKRLVSFLFNVVDVINDEIIKKDKVGTLWDDLSWSSVHLEGEVVYSNGKKPISLIKRMLDMQYIGDNDIVLDFFAGSSSTAHSLLKYCNDTLCHSKFIMVQLPESLDDNLAQANNAKAKDDIKKQIAFLDSINKPHLITEIGKERIRRSALKIIAEQESNTEGGLFAEVSRKLDTGFKVFKLDSSNIYSWDSSPENLEQSLNNSLFNIKEDRTEDDLLYEILIKYGVGLSVKINRHTIAGKTVYEMGAGSLIVCLADDLTKEVAEGIAALYKSVSPEGEHLPCRVVFKESGFNGSDEVKSNTMLILKQHGITNVASV